MSTERWVGRVAIEWSKLEACMDDLIWSFLNLSMDYGRIVTGRTDANGKIQMLRALGNLGLPDDQKAPFSEILNSIDEMREDRNLMLHGSWGVIDPGNKIMVASLKPKPDNPFNAVSEHFPQERMQIVRDRILNLKAALIHVRERLDLKRGVVPGQSWREQSNRPSNFEDQS